MEKDYLTALSVADLLELYAEILNELQARNVVHSTNNPVANYAEKLANKALNLTGMPESTKGFDAIDCNGQKYEIKGRRPTKKNPSRQLSMIRELNNHHFDYLIGILFYESFKVYKACVIPHHVIVEKAKYTKHANACIFHLDDSIWQITGVKDITAEIQAIQENQPSQQGENMTTQAIDIPGLVLPLPDNDGVTREWTGNDGNRFHHHGIVRLDESPLKIRLYWRSSKDSTKKLIGNFLLDLHGLLKAGLVRLENQDAQKIRLRFTHTNGSFIEISQGTEHQGLRIATFEE